MTYVPHFLSSTHARVTLVHIHHHIINIFLCRDTKPNTSSMTYIVNFPRVVLPVFNICGRTNYILLKKKFILSCTPQLSKSLSAVMVQNHLHHPLPPIYWCSRQPAQEVTQKSILLKKVHTFQHTPVESKFKCCYGAHCTILCPQYIGVQGRLHQKLPKNFTFFRIAGQLLHQGRSLSEWSKPWWFSI